MARPPRQLERTITKELHDAWLRLKRKGDPETMAKELGYSRPVIDKALLYGYVTMSELPGQINAFFKARIEAEKRQAKELTDMADQLAK